MSISTKNRRRPAPVAQPRQTEAFRELDADLYFANQLFRYGLGSQIITGGVTGSVDRKARIRKHIHEANLAERACLDQRNNPTDETLAAAFERLYHEPLEGDANGHIGEG